MYSEMSHTSARVLIRVWTMSLHKLLCYVIVHTRAQCVLITKQIKSADNMYNKLLVLHTSIQRMRMCVRPSEAAWIQEIHLYQVILIFNNVANQ